MTMSASYWNGWGVTEIGPSHTKNHIPNQDSFKVKKFKWGIVGVVCDGLGSKKYSHIGSKALTNALIKASQIFDFEKVEIELFEPLVKSLWDINIYPYEENDCSTTLLFVAIKYDKVYIGRVGDGAIGILGENSKLIEEKKDTFVNYTTPFGRDESIHWEIYDEKNINSIVLCSDGIYEDIQKDKIIDFFNEYINTYKDSKSIKRTNEIKKWLKNWPVKGHSDDKTIASLVKMDKNEKNRSI